MDNFWQWLKENYWVYAGAFLICLVLIYIRQSSDPIGEEIFK